MSTSQTPMLQQQPPVPVASESYFTGLRKKLARMVKIRYPQQRHKIWDDQIEAHINLIVGSLQCLPTNQAVEVLRRFHEYIVSDNVLENEIRQLAPGRSLVKVVKFLQLWRGAYIHSNLGKTTLEESTGASNDLAEIQNRMRQTGSIMPTLPEFCNANPDAKYFLLLIQSELLGSPRIYQRVLDHLTALDTGERESTSSHLTSRELDLYINEQLEANRCSTGDEDGGSGTAATRTSQNIDTHPFFQNDGLEERALSVFGDLLTFAEEEVRRSAGSLEIYFTPSDLNSEVSEDGEAIRTDRDGTDSEDVNNPTRGSSEVSGRSVSNSTQSKDSTVTSFFGRYADGWEL